MRGRRRVQIVADTDYWTEEWFSEFLLSFGRFGGGAASFLVRMD